MGKSNGTDVQQETWDYVQMHIYKVPKKNHEAIVQIGNQGYEIGNKYGDEVCMSSNMDTQQVY